MKKIKNTAGIEYEKMAGMKIKPSFFESVSPSLSLPFSS